VRRQPTQIVVYADTWWGTAVEAGEVSGAQGEGVVVADQFHQHAADEEDEVSDVGSPIFGWHDLHVWVLGPHLLGGSGGAVWVDRCESARSIL